MFFCVEIHDCADSYGIWVDTSQHGIIWNASAIYLSVYYSLSTDSSPASYAIALLHIVLIRIRMLAIMNIIIISLRISVGIARKYQ
ncbi:hypothetical protein CPU03_01875 [Edwardsiella tarda]|nr:hypothetical protein CPU03_01875 [Edwardsiella tarda]